jgi:OmpA-OmpF porin, OOP family
MMRKMTKSFRVAALAAPVLVASILAAPITASADTGIDTYWKSTPTTSAWVTNYKECWQGKGGTQLDPCGAPAPAFVPHTPLVLRLLFGLNKYQLQDISNAEELRKLDGLIKDFLATPREEVVTIVGHTDKLGSLEHNLILSERRAETIKNYMINKGYPARAIRSVKGVAWEGGNDVAADGTYIDLGPLENNPLRRRVVVSELGPDQIK